MIKRYLFGTVFIVLSLVGCTDPPIEIDAIYGDFTLEPDGKVAEFDGIVDSTAYEDLSEMLSIYNFVEEMDIVNANGDAGSPFAFEMAELLRNNNINCTILENGTVEGAGTFFFLGGNERRIEGNGKIGVNSWQTSSGQEASTLDNDDLQHDEHIEFLIRIGYSESEAEAFYFFTLNAAASNDIYFLTDQEIQDFKLLN